MRLTWSLSESNILQTIKSASANPREFVLPAYALKVGAFYTVTLTARHLVSLKSGSASTQVYVETGKIVCVLSSGSHLSMRVDESARVDWSRSYDENIQNSFGTSAGLSFSTQCFQSSPMYRENCSLILLPSGTDALSIQVDPHSPFPAAVADIFTITVVATSLNTRDLRTSQAVVQISIIDSVAPVVAISAPSGIRMNPASKLQLIATIDLKSEGDVTWMVNDPTIPLSRSALSELTQTLPASIPGTLHVISLVLSGSTLPEQSSFTFSLQVRYGDSNSLTKSIVIQTNSPPIPGSFEITPVSGISCKQSFP